MLRNSILCGVINSSADFAVSVVFLLFILSHKAHSLPHTVNQGARGSGWRHLPLKAAECVQDEFGLSQDDIRIEKAILRR